MSENERDGKLIVVVSVVSVFVWFVLSDGYVPQFNFFENFYEYLTFYHASWFCKDIPGIYDSVSQECWNWSLETKYLVLLSLVVGSWGLLIWKELIPNHVARWRELRRKGKTPPV